MVSAFQRNTPEYQNPERMPEKCRMGTAAVLAQSVERVDCRSGGRGFDSWGRTNTQGLKITEK